MSFSIPPDINSWDRLRTAEFYHRDLGWAVHALCPPNRGQDHERGKKPIAKGWRSHTAAEVTPDYLREHFANGSNFNLGVVVRGPFVHVDLDSKPDAGESVRTWLSSQPQLASIPRERTGGGAHLVFVCRDLPETVAAAKKAITAQVNATVTAEFYAEGMNLVVSPSVHKSGARYTWDVTGEIPEVSWAQIRQWFGFEEPAGAKRGRPGKEKPWWARFKGALHTLDAVALFREVDLLGDAIDPDVGKWSVRCPWEREHSAAKGGNGCDTDTVIFQAESADSPPGFKCLHAHCAERSLKEVLETLDDQKSGIVDRHCREMRVWIEGQASPDGRQRVLLPEMDRPDSEFAAEMGQQIGPRKVWFNKVETVVAVAMRRFSENITALTFHPVQPVEACTAAEQFVQTGVLREDKASGDMVFLRHTMTRECAAKLMAAPQFRRKLPEIIRILDIPLPIRTPGDGIVFPETGYDPRFRSYLDPEAPRIRPMPFERAVELLQEVHAEFGWKDGQSLVHALARIITPFCRGLMGWDARFPLWHFSGNRPRAGKDYLAGITQILYEGRTCEDAPLERESEETRKRITAALMAGRRSMHFANCQGYIQDAAFIGAITSKTFAARNLGSTEAKADLTLPNEIEFSLSANVGLTFREDVEPRTRRISLVFFEENPNGRKFSTPDLHGWVLEKRGELLSAIGALVKRWVESGCPNGPTPFNSFPEWGRVVGGIMHACGLGDPCLPHLADEGEVGGDRQDKAMRALYRIMFENHPDTWIEKAELFRLVGATDDEDLAFFGSFEDGHSKDTKKRIGMTLRQFRDRELAGVVLEVDAHGKGDRQQVRFSSAASRTRPSEQILLSIFGNLGNPGKGTSCLEVAEEKIREKKENTKELKERGKKGGVGVSKVSEVSTISDPAAFAEIADCISAAGSVALDVETFGSRKADALNPWRGDIRLLSLKVADREPWLIDLQSTGYALGPLSTALEAVLVIAHNLKFDALWLAVKCGLRLRRVFCTLVASRLLTAGTRPGNDLDKCLERYLGIKPGDDHGRSDWGGMFLTDGQLDYAARDVAHLHALYDVLTLKLEQSGLGDVAELEMALQPVIVGMETAGIAVDRVKLEAIRDHARAESEMQTAALRDALGDRQINLSSPAQLQSALAKAGLALPNTNEETLKASADERFVPIILAHRSAEKTAQQAQSLLECIAADGRIHGRFDPTGTATGRFSSKEPNLQNIGRGPLRSCFVAPEGSKLVVADYSQIELRAAAAIAGESKMIQAYQRGEDLHRGTAAAVLGKAVEAVTKEDRQLAKAVNFGLLYGQSAPGLVKYAASSYGVTLPEDDAKEIRAKFFRTYGSLRQWHGESHRRAEEGVSEVRTVMGRRRLIPADASAWERFTALVNTPVQGGCADGMKRALVKLAATLPAAARIVSTVHDEIIVETPTEEAEPVRQMVESVMVEAMAALFPQVPVEVEANVCASWGEK